MQQCVQALSLQNHLQYDIQPEVLNAGFRVSLRNIINTESLMSTHSVIYVANESAGRTSIILI